ncbi:hypothetical protein HOY82DRAFT_536650 [Tuber indicum]|nr:hypothetical protein HOY82DRAFT_536650 [Tuber indicum]
MSGNLRGGMSERSAPTHISSSENEGTASQTPISCLNPANAPPAAHPASPGPSRLPRPVFSCQYVFRGEIPYQHFWRHLKHSDLCGLNSGEHERLQDALGLTLPQPQPCVSSAEDNKAEEERKSRTAKFELRAKRMAITCERSVAEKVAIWEGMWAAEQAGDSIQVGAPYLIPLSPPGHSGIVAD